MYFVINMPATATFWGETKKQPSIYGVLKVYCTIYGGMT